MYNTCIDISLSLSFSFSLGRPASSMRCKSQISQRSKTKRFDDAKLGNRNAIAREVNPACQTIWKHRERVAISRWSAPWTRRSFSLNDRRGDHGRGVLHLARDRGMDSGWCESKDYPAKMFRGGKQNGRNPIRRAIL